MSSPPPSPAKKPPQTFLIPTSIVEIREVTRQQWVKGVGKDAEFTSQSFGWFVLFDGSREFLYLGPDKPDWVEGEEIEILLRRPSNAPPR